MYSTCTQCYQLSVAPTDRPQTIETINVTKVSFFTVRVEWNIPFNNLNNISMYHVSYTERLADDIDGLPTTISSTTINSILIQNVGINKMYDLTITSRNGVGDSDPSRIVSFTSITSSKFAFCHYTMCITVKADCSVYTYVLIACN